MFRKKPDSPPFSRKLFDQGSVVAEGACIGVGGRFATWFLEKGYMDASEKGNTKTYSQIFRHIFTWKELRKLNKDFLNAGLMPTIGKSASNMGVVNWVECFHPELSPWQKGLWISGIGTPFETLLTAKGEWTKVLKWRTNAIPVKTTYFSANFVKVLMGSGIRIGATSLNTFLTIYGTMDWMKRKFPQQDQAKLKATGAGIASFVIQPFNMPFINFQTWVLMHSGKSFPEIIKSFYESHTVTDIFKGSLGRSIYRSAYYSLTFFMAAKLTEYKQSQDEAKALSPTKNKSNR